MGGSTGSGSTTPSQCPGVGYKGNGYCDDENNIAGCEYDGGDCCQKEVGLPVVKTYCQECKCLDPKFKSLQVAFTTQTGTGATVSAGPTTAYENYYYQYVLKRKSETTTTSLCPSPKVGYKGDGYCDDENNIAACEYDAGDCCLTKSGAPVVKTYCQECKCLDPAFQSLQVASAHSPHSPVCPECATFKGSGKRSCCAHGGSWSGNCGSAGSGSTHTWVEGMEACNAFGASAFKSGEAGVRSVIHRRSDVKRIRWPSNMTRPNAVPATSNGCDILTSLRSYCSILLLALFLTDYSN